MDRMGIMLKFLATLILALIIFIPACLFTSSLFRMSDQAKDSFGNFAKVLQDFAVSNEESKSFLLVMDEDTFITNFQQGRNIIFNKEISTPGGMENYEYSLSYPSEQCEGQDCICLCRKIDETEINPEDARSVESKKKVCSGPDTCVWIKEGEQLTAEQNLVLDKGSGPTGIIDYAFYKKELLCESYSCKPLNFPINDFFLTRHTEKTRKGDVLELSPRRRVISLSKRDGNIYVE